jgi:hypothetical protein
MRLVRTSGMYLARRRFERHTPAHMHSLHGWRASAALSRGVILPYEPQAAQLSLKQKRQGPVVRWAARKS